MTDPARNTTLTHSEKELLGEVRQQILRRLPAPEVYLYGSVARGTYGPESDYDILVLTDEKLSWREQDSVRGDVFGVELKRGPVICLLFKSKADWNSPVFRVSPFYKEVEADKVAL